MGWSGWYHTLITGFAPEATALLYQKSMAKDPKNAWEGWNNMMKLYIYIHQVDSFYGQVIQRKEVGRFGLRPSLGEKRKVWTSAIHNSLGKSNPFGKKHHAACLYKKKGTRIHMIIYYIYMYITIYSSYLLLFTVLLWQLLLLLQCFDVFGVLRCFESSGWPATRGGIPSYDCAIWADLGFPASQVSQIS
jgi:hypothetical protein